MADPLTDLINTFKCPVNILQNINVCAIYYMEDVIMSILFSIVWLLILIFIYFPIYLAVNILCLCVRHQLMDSFGWDACQGISIDDICPSKYFFATFIESVWQICTGTSLFARSGGDVGMCYCMSSIATLFQPLENFENFFYKLQGDVSGGGGGSGSGGSKNNGSFIFTILVCFIIFGLLYFNRE